MLMESVALGEPFAFVPEFIETTPQATLSGLFAGQPSEALETGAALFWQGDSAQQVFRVEAGALRIVHVLSDGRRVITGFLLAGDLVGVSLQDRYLYTAEAIQPTRVRRLARRRFDAAVNADGALRPQLFAQLCAEMAAAHEQVVLLARKSAEERVCSFLLGLVRRVGRLVLPAPVLDLPMTRLDMADYLGLTIETVSRVMTRLQGSGVIEQVGRHVVTVLRPARLALLAGVDDDEEGPAERALCAH